MSMSVGTSSSDEEYEALSTINTTPLVDVMLVLLIIFLITIPVITKSVPVSLPKAANIPTQTKPENISVSVDSDGKIYWNDKKVESSENLLALVVETAKKTPQPEIHIRGDGNARYEAIGKLMFAIQRGGIVKVGFLTEPDRGFRTMR